MVRVGLVGCGTIGSQLALALQRNYSNAARITALHDVDRAHARALQRRLTHHPHIVSLPMLIRESQLVIEAASADVASEVVRQALRAGRSVFVMSVGGLLRDPTWQRLARRSGGKVYIPSGALAGLDGVKALAVGRIRRVSLTTRKPPRALTSAPYVRRRRLRLERLTRPSLLFEGSARTVVEAFPQNTNVAAALALALHRSGVGRASGDPGARARIRVVADPTIRVNVHELDVAGDCGRIQCRIESRPSANPKTSELAVRSAIATLGRIFDPVSIGT
jgi:aspartate dehydrogenase